MGDFTPEQWLVFQYSEWLDGEGLLSAEDPHQEGRFPRSHTELVREFLHEQKGA